MTRRLMKVKKNKNVLQDKKTVVHLQPLRTTGMLFFV